MALPSFFKRKTPPPQPPATPVGDDAGLAQEGQVQKARAQARRRLIGAVVLLALGVVGFPLLFETQPRPLPRDIPIEMPRPAAASSITPAPTATPRRAVVLPVVPESPPSLPSAPPAPTPPVTAVAPLPVPASAAVSATPSASAPHPPPLRASASMHTPASPTPPPAPATRQAKPAPASAAAPAPSPAPTPRPTANDGGRARTLRQGGAGAEAARPAAAASENKTARFVVQVGAYNDTATLREVRAKIEKLGFKSYTQDVEIESGKRTRVRVGPFNTRQDAEAASATLKAAGLPGYVARL
jgi:DedD protein